MKIRRLVGRWMPQMPWGSCRWQEIRESKRGCFLSRHISEPAPHKGSSQPAAGKTSVFWVLGNNVVLVI